MTKNISSLFLLLLFVSRATPAPPPATDFASRVWLLDNSVMPLSGAKATLIVGPLTRKNNLYVGDFKVKVFPYFFKNDWGRLAINVPDSALVALDAGKAVAISGKSISLKNGDVRHVEITATPIDRYHGNVSLWFMVGTTKMIFTPAYRVTNGVTTTSGTTSAPSEGGHR